MGGDEGHEGDEESDEEDESHEGHEGDEEGDEGHESHEGDEGDEEVRACSRRCVCCTSMFGHVVGRLVWREGVDVPSSQRAGGFCSIEMWTSLKKKKKKKKKVLSLIPLL